MVDFDVPTTFELDWQENNISTDPSKTEDKEEMYDRVACTVKNPEDASTKYVIEVLDEDKNILRTMTMEAEWIETRIESGFLKPE